MLDASMILAAIVLATFIAEPFLSGRWNRFYFTVGVPVLIATFPLQSRMATLPPTGEIEAKLPAGGLIRIKAFDNFTYGFREKLFLSRGLRSPIIHGLLIYDIYQGRLVVKGLLNWTFMALTVIWYQYAVSEFSRGGSGMSLLLVVVHIAISLAIYFTQRKKYVAIGRVVESLLTS